MGQRKGSRQVHSEVLRRQLGLLPCSHPSQPSLCLHAWPPCRAACEQPRDSPDAHQEPQIAITAELPLQHSKEVCRCCRIPPPAPARCLAQAIAPVCNTWLCQGEPEPWAQPEGTGTGLYPSRSRHRLPGATGSSLPQAAAEGWDPGRVSSSEMEIQTFTQLHTASSPCRSFLQANSQSITSY